VCAFIGKLAGRSPAMPRPFPHQNAGDRSTIHGDAVKRRLDGRTWIERGHARLRASPDPKARVGAMTCLPANCCFGRGHTYRGPLWAQCPLAPRSRGRGTGSRCGQRLSPSTRREAPSRTPGVPRPPTSCCCSSSPPGLSRCGRRGSLDDGARGPRCAAGSRRRPCCSSRRSLKIDSRSSIACALDSPRTFFAAGTSRVTSRSLARRWT
jgi:hypothetical protein